MKKISILSMLMLSATSSSLFAGISTNITINFIDVPPQSVPVFSGPMLLGLSALLFVVGYRMFRNRDYSRVASLLVIGLAFLSSSYGGMKIVEDAHATGSLLSSGTNGSITSTGGYGNNSSFAVENDFGVPKKITSIVLTNPAQCSIRTDDNSGIDDCQEGGVIPSGGVDRNARSCEVRIACN